MPCSKTEPPAAPVTTTNTPCRLNCDRLRGPLIGNSGRSTPLRSRTSPRAPGPRIDL
jgi:hypothetical protein